MKEVDSRICAIAAQRVGTRRGKYTQEAVRRLHAEKGVHVCVACAAQRMAEAREEAKGAAEREAAAEALEEARAAARQVKPGVGAEATGALAAQERRAEERCKKAAQVTKLGDVEAADALWQARCALAKAPLDLAGAFPGVWCCSPEQVRSERRSHPLWHGANGGLLGSVFEDDSGKTWCVEELATDEAGCQVGIYAYDTARWASAALRLDERCTFFGQDVLEEVERQQEATARAVTDFLGG